MVPLQVYLRELNARVPHITAQLRKALPVYRAAEQGLVGAPARHSGLSGLGDWVTDPTTGDLIYQGTADIPGTAPAASSGFDIGGFLTTLSTTAQKLLPVYNQQQLFDANLELARQGKAPINPSTLAPQYQVGLTSNTMLMLGAVVLAVVLIGKKK